MHNTEVKTEVIPNQEQQQQQQVPHHSQPNVIVPHRRMANGEAMVSGASRHHREGTTLTMSSNNTNNECAGCGKRITERFLLKALDLFWHEDCLKCGCCDCRLGEVGSTLYTKANLILCKRDYLRLFGNTGYCSACSKVIPAFEMVMRARSNVYHLECFACQQCNHRFCVGDRFYLCENKILCEYDYEERMVFANMACSPNNLAILRRQVSTFQQPGAQGEQQQQPQPQQQFVGAAGGSGVLGVNEQYQQFDEQPKYAFPLPKVPVSEPFVLASYSSFANSPSPSAPLNPSPETSYITKQPRLNLKERTDSFFHVKCSPSSTLTSPPPSTSSPPPPPAKRPKQSFPSFDTGDNLNSSPIIQYSERNNNTSNGNNGKMPMFLSSPPVFNPLLMQAGRDSSDDLLAATAGIGRSRTVCAKISVAPNAANNAMGSPDSGIVEGP